MTQKQKNYIENNSDLIENEDWNKFFQNAPYGTGGIIYECGIDFMRNMEKIPQRCFLGSDLKIISIPDSVTSIGSSAFEYCKNLTRVIIPDSVTYIAHYAFQDCHNLISVNFKGTKAQWDAITKIRSFDKTVMKIICTDGIIELYNY